MPQMGYDTKTDRLTDCQSQCDFDFDLLAKVEVLGVCILLSPKFFGDLRENHGKISSVMSI
jgi:hypothetical protein